METLIHNTLSGAYVVLENQALEVLRRADRGETLSAAEQAMASDADLFDPDVAICVESRAAEEKEFRDWFEGKRNHNVLSVMIGINLACNFDCPYCSQATVMSGQVMSEDICDQTADWLSDRAHAVGLDQISLNFVGGEPLLHPKRIERIATRIQASGVSFSFGLITNGYFLTEEMVDRLIPFGLRGAQITLDGDETTHDLTRVSKKNEFTFDRLFQNTIAASKKISVIINGNYQDNTIAGFGPLLDKLAQAGLPQGSLTSFSPALSGLSTESGVGSGSCTFSGSDTRYQTALYDRAIANGFDAPELHALGPCSFHERHSFAIDPDGVILKCPGFLGHGHKAKWGIGHVATGLDERHRRMVDLTPVRECGGCAHRPNCGGGCVAAQWLELDRVEGVNCEHSYFESVTRDGVVRSYLLESLDIAEAIQYFPDATMLPHQKEPVRRLPVVV